MDPGPIDMRHTKLKAEEAALLAGELVKPTWASRNEGIHERVSFEDTLWGFEMAGGAYYNTPLRVAYVRPDSRAERACIRMGDTVLRINGQETSNLTLQEAHKLVLDAGINLKIVVTAPEDLVNAHYDYQDPLIDTSGPTPEQLKEMELERVRKALERASRCKELPWPWVRRKWIIYRESNCFMVPSKYENKHREKFPELPSQRVDYFYPAEKVSKVQSKKDKDSAKSSENSKVDSARLEDQSQSMQDDINNKQIDPNITKEEDKENGADNLEPELENVNEENLEDSQRKDSDQSSASNYELDNYNNHVVKSKDEPTNETNQDAESKSDDNIIDEIVAQPAGLQEVEENVPKSEDDILDSVLNDNIESKDLENGR